MIAVASLLYARNEPLSGPRSVLMRDMIVSYARPFSGNRAGHLRKHKLQAERVPDEYKWLHEDLLQLRNELIAHTDLLRRNPRVNTIRGTLKFIACDGPDYDALFALHVVSRQ